MVNEEKNIITEDLSGIIRRASVTNLFYDNKKSSDRLKKAEQDASEIEWIVRNVYVLKTVRKLMLELGLQKVSTLNGNTVFSKKQTSTQFIKDIITSLERKKDNLIGNINKEISDLPLMSEKHYDAYVRGCYHYSWNSHYFGCEEIAKGLDGVLRVIDYDTVEETAKKKVRLEAIRIKKRSYRAVSKRFVGANGDENIEYIHFDNVVDACLYNYEKTFSKEIADEIKKLNSSENSINSSTLTYIEKKYNYWLIHFINEYRPTASVSSLREIVEQLISLNKKCFLYEESILMFERLLDFINANFIVFGSEKYDIVNKMKKEITVFKQNCVQLNSQIFELEKKFDLEKSRIQSQTSKQSESPLKKSESPLKKNESPLKKNGKGLEEKDNIVPGSSSEKGDVVDSKKKQIESLEAAKKKLLTIGKMQVDETKASSQEQKELYEKYKVIREILDDLFERKSQFKNEDYFRQEVVWNLSRYGDTYEDIIKAVNDMREQLEVTQIIQSIIDDVRMEYSSIEEMRQEEENGLTNFENRIIGRLLHISFNNEIPDQLRSEINYYAKKHQKLESALKFAFMNKSRYSKEVYQDLLESLKMQYYINTNMLNEVSISKNVYSSRNF